MVTRLAQVTGVVAACLLVSGCGLGTKVCTEMGAYSGVNFDFESVLEDTTAQGATVEACVDGDCTDRTLQNRRDSQLFVEDATLDDDATVPVALTVTTKTGEVVFDGRTEVTPEKSQPNGPGCDPTVYGAQVTATGGGTLTDEGE